MELATKPAASRALYRAHGWLIAALIAFSQPWGLTAADTKHDLAANPWGFLRGALEPYTDTFTLGQLQNQAYGYLFPQGAFFALTDFMPDWVAQRLWWTLILGLAYYGMLSIARACGLHLSTAMVAGAAYALSPRILTTLTAISSEAWPVALAPWIALPFLANPSPLSPVPRSIGQRKQWLTPIAASLIAVGCLGAVNATATMAACVPAAIILLARRAWRSLFTWLAGCALMSLWWIGPLLVLGSYAPPFTDYIESSYVTTRWLNLVEILRGTTSWSPFVDSERHAGYLLATQPVFIVATGVVAALGLMGLRRAGRVWAVMVLAGCAIMGCTWGFYHEFLDGTGAALRNLHKFDPLVRMPLALGLGFTVARLGAPTSSRCSPHHDQGSNHNLTRGQRRSAVALVVMVTAASCAPAWTGRLLPTGAYERVDHKWQQAADYLNAHASHTRTLIYPERSFAREDWGWTRDEPLQPLLDVPWAVRDAIPLVPPEAIRGLDGAMAALRLGNTQALQRLGIGAIVVRGEQPLLPKPTVTFDELGIIMVAPQRQVLLSSDSPIRVAGGGESLAFIDGPATLVDGDAEVVTDTPLEVDRNYGTLVHAQSAPLAEGDPRTSHNAVRDYPSAGRRVLVEETGGHVAASSSAADASALGTPAQSVTAAVDGRNDTAWWPAAEDSDPWLEFQLDPARLNAHPATGLNTQPATSMQLTLSATRATTVTVSGDNGSVEVPLPAGEERTITVPGGSTRTVRIGLHQRVGLNAQLSTPITRIVTVPAADSVRQFIFQRLMVDTGVIIRRFYVPRDETFTLDSNRWVSIDDHDVYPGQDVKLATGWHVVQTKATWMKLTAPGFHTGTYEDSNGMIAAADHERTLVTGRAANKGLRGFVGATPLEALTADASTQAYRLPAGVSGQFRQEFVAPYRAFLFIGGLIAAIMLALCVCFVALTRRAHAPSAPSFATPAASTSAPASSAPSFATPAAPTSALGLVFAAGCLLVVSPLALGGAAVGYAAARFTNLRAGWLIGGLMGASAAMLARAAWPAANYAGDSWLAVGFAAAAVGAMIAAAGRSTQ